MDTTTPVTSSARLVPISDPMFADAERVALAGFLAGYRGQTRDAYALDLRQFTTWCHQRQLRLFTATRADIETFARDMEPRAVLDQRLPDGCAPSVVSTGTPKRKA